MELTASLRGFRKSHRVDWAAAAFPLEAGSRLESLGDVCTVKLRTEKTGGVIRGAAVFTFEKPTALASNVAPELAVDGWSRENYVFLPGAVYNGNRFDCQKLPYPPYAQIPEGRALTAPPVVADIPRLSIDDGASRIDFRSGDMTTPAAGYYDAAARRGVLLFTTHTAHGEYTGVSVREEGDAARFAVSVPAVREDTKYFFGELPDGRGFYPCCTVPSDDTGRWFEAGDRVILPFCLCDFAAEDLTEFFTVFNRARTCLERGVPASVVPLGKAYRTVKEKYRRENYIRDGQGGFYTVGTDRELPQQIWQAGWIGGGMNGYPFLLEDGGQARERALDTFRFIFDRLQMKNGWVCGMYANGVFYGDTFDLSRPSDVLLIRKDADLLYFALKQYLACREELADYGGRLQALCGAFVRLYRKYGQIGQFIHTETDTISIGNSACGAIACAALALGYDVFGERGYLKAAEGLGELYEREYLLRGVVTGCPGEICQAPDSEGAFGLLEGYVQLYETTGKERWLRCARQAAELAMTWVMSYDFQFPHETAAAKRGVHTMGTVFANAQNKHSAPGICTLSGNSLLKLYRFTGDEVYLSWLKAIVRALPQFVSLPERPVFTLDGKYLPEGWVNERVQTSDWEGKLTIGEFLYGSNWPEVCVLLSYVEVPGVYADLRAGKVTGFDSVSCGVLETEAGSAMRLWLRNDTVYDAEVTLLADDPSRRQAVTHNYFGRMEKLELRAGEYREVQLRL